MDYNITNINPKLWGYSGWIFLNSIALVYTPEKKEKYYNFFSNLILPCNTCGHFYEIKLKDLNDALLNKDTLLQWLLNIRNDINKQNNKKILTIDESIKQIYNNSYSYTLHYIIVFLIIIIIILCFTKKV